MTGIKTTEALLFDLDGTLIDTEELILSSFRYTLTSVLGQAPPDDVLRDKIGIPLRNQMQAFDADRVEELLTVYRKHNVENHDALVKEFPGVAEVLLKLNEAGYRLAVVTSKMSDMAQKSLRFFGLEDYFEFVQGSDKTERHKPNPDPLLFAAETMGLAPEQCAYIGDSPYDMCSARAAGMLAVAALWGMFTRERLLEAGAQREATTIDDLPKLFPL